MAYERKPGDIAIFAEKNKTNERAPDWKGELMTPAGEKLSVALWLKSDTMLAGKVEAPRARQDEGESFRGGREGGVSGGDASARRTPAPADLDDEIPF